MFTLLFYTGVCAAIAGVLTLFSTVFKPIHKKGDSKPWLVLLGFFVFVFALPFIYTETLTKMIGPKVATAVKEVYDGSDIQGPMRYFRVIGYRPDKDASVLVVGSERESWGGTDRPVLSVHLVKEGSDWKADSYHIVSCERLNKDGYTFPPYW
jgi:hypothetical protein